MFMKNWAATLNPGGRLAITAPNPRYINPILKNCFGRYTFVDSADHVAWYDASTLFELGQRHGFELERFTGITVHNPKTFRAKQWSTPHHNGPGRAIICEVDHLRVRSSLR
jgi:hypothetical protein